MVHWQQTYFTLLANEEDYSTTILNRYLYDSSLYWTNTRDFFSPSSYTEPNTYSNIETDRATSYMYEARSHYFDTGHSTYLWTLVHHYCYDFLENRDHSYSNTFYFASLSN